MKKLLLLACILMLDMPLIAQTVSVVRDNVPNAGPMYYFHQRKVARSTTGVLVVAWTDKAAAGGQVYYSTFDPTFQTWSAPVAISNAADRASQPSLAADGKGNIHACWQQRASSTAPYQVFYSKFDGISWSTLKKISLNDAEPAEEATIEVASDGNIYVIYNNDGAGVGKEWIFAIKSTNNGTTWSTSADTLSKGGTLGTSIEVARVAVAVGPNGRLAAVWDNSLTGSGTRRETYVNQYDGKRWQGEVRISDTTYVDRDHNRYSAIAIDNQSNIYVFYIQDIIAAADARPRKLVMHKKTWDGVWSTKPTLVIDSSRSGYREVSAVTDEDGVIHLCYRRDVAADTTYGLDEMVYTFSKNGGETWKTPLVISRPDHDAGYITIANRVHKTYGIDIAWRESRDINRNDQDTTAILYGNVPYSYVTTNVWENPAPLSYSILSNYPNPFNPSTTIRYTVPMRCLVSLAIYDALGKEVKLLANGEKDAGEYSVVWDGTNNASQRVTSGVYFARLTTARDFRVVKMLLLK